MGTYKIEMGDAQIEAIVAKEMESIIAMDNKDPENTEIVKAAETILKYYSVPE